MCGRRILSLFGQCYNVLNSKFSDSSNLVCHIFGFHMSFLTIFFFHLFISFFSCSGMYRDVSECSMFRFYLTGIFDS